MSQRKRRKVDPVSFVNSLDLDDITSEGKNKYEGYVDAGSLVSFTEELTTQNKADVLNSTLLAQLVANKKHDRAKEADNWYKEYLNVLENVGWVLQEFNFTKYESNQPSFEISEVAVKMFLETIGFRESILLEIVKKTLDALKKSSLDTIKLFDSNSTSATSGNFQIIPCTLNKSNQVTGTFLGIYFSAPKVGDKFLFFRYDSAEINLHMSTNAFTLNEKIYGQVRQAILDKLGKSAKSFVDKLCV